MYVKLDQIKVDVSRLNSLGLDPAAMYQEASGKWLDELARSGAGWRAGQGIEPKDREDGSRILAWYVDTAWDYYVVVLSADGNTVTAEFHSAVPEEKKKWFGHTADTEGSES